MLYFYYYITGRYNRFYDWIAFDDVIGINSSNILCKDLLENYKPIVYQDNNLRGPRPQKIYAECIRDREKNILTLVYRVYWETEKHPYLFFDKLYSIFRAAFYGSKIDLEFIQLKLNKDQEILEIKFESDPSNDPDILCPQHKLASFKPEMIPKDNNLYELSTILWTLTYNKRKYIKKDLSFEKTDNNHQKTHLAVRAFTWNHLYSIGQDFNNCQMFDLPLEELTESIYRSLKIARRSWGDYGRPTNRRKSIAQGIFFSTTTTLLIVIICLFILNYFKL